MRKILASIALTCALSGAASHAQKVGAQPPEFEAVKWYNTPPLALSQLRDKAILVEVFRTW
ncbi:MAG TPA: hypothetical protein ENJ09_04205 [Planctomycetes bacterium]|nr:hypothetical protein [Planctomycetota bacterium]